MSITKNDIVSLTIEKLKDKDIKTYDEFIFYIENIGRVSYIDLYNFLYVEK